MVSLSEKTQHWQANDDHGSEEICIGSCIMEGQATEEVMATQLSLSSSMSLRELKDNAEIWICDTGATTHSSFSNMGATNEIPSRSTSVGHHGEAVEAVSVMDLPGHFVTKDGELGLSGRLGEVTFNPGLNFNLFSATRMMRRGWKMYGTDNAIVLKKGEHEIVFDIVVETAKGAIYACRFMREGCDSDEITAVSTTSASGTKMSLKKAHSLLGHINIDATRAIAKVLGWNITRDKVDVCIACALAKAKQKNVCKLSERPKAVVVGGCLFIDLSVLTVPKDQGMSKIRNKNWLLVVDERSNKKWSSFFSSKNGFIEPFVEFLSQLKARGIPVLVLRMDPSGENHKLVKRLKSVECQHLQPIDIEMTARDTPQFNSLVEVAFPFLAGKARAIMNDANIPIEYRAALAILAIEFATVVDGLTAIDVEGKKMTRDQLVFGANNKWVNNMHTFGEAVVVAEGKDSKTGNRGTEMMFVGYPSNRSSDTFKLWNQNTNRVVTSRDVIWLKKMYFAPSTDDDTDITFYVDGEEAIETESSQDDDEDDGGGDDGDVEGDEATESTPVASQRSVAFAEPVTPERGAAVDRQATPAASNNRFGAFQDEDSSDDDSQESEVGESVVEHTSATRVADRVSRSGRRIYNTEKQNQLTGLVAIEQTYLMHLMELDNVELAATMIASELTDVNDLETSLVGAGLGGGFKNTRELKVMNYSQAMASLYKAECQEEVDNEHARFEKWEAFKPVLKSDLPHDAKVCSTTWAIKKKSNGKWRARLNLRGFEQQEDLHYNPSNISAPVTNVYTVRLLLILWCLNPSWVGKLMDVCAAFLQGEFQDGEVIYIKVPQGFEKYYSEDVVLQVLVPLYGMKQAGAAFYNTLVKKIIKSDGAQLERSKADPCVYFMNRDDKLVAVMASWVDDMMIVGEPDAAEEIQCILESSFECEREGDLLEYVGSKISMTTREDGGRSIKITQPVLMQKPRTSSCLMWKDLHRRLQQLRVKY